MALDQAGAEHNLDHRVVNVALAERSYEIKIGPGLLGRAGELLAADFPNARVAIVTDTNVAQYHLSTLESSIKAACQHIGSIVLPAGEATKSFNELERLCGRLLDLELERGDLVIALGGGVIGDLTGFAAAIVRRGVNIVQAPTTLLAQVDSAIGGKTGINTSHGKNLIGAFHQPSLVLADSKALDTLDARQMRAGYAEVAKYGLIGDADFFGWLEANASDVLAGGTTRDEAIEKSARAKATIVAADERESGERALLNLGHTFGHALEANAGYSNTLLHGEAVSIGMTLAFQLSHELDLSSESDVTRVTTHLRDVGLPTSIGEIDGPTPKPAKLIGLMAQDKKVQQSRPTLILVRGIGEAFIEPALEWDLLENFIARRCEAQ